VERGELQEQLLAIITQESQRLSRMINQLLDLSRIEAGKTEWRFETLELAEVVAHAVQANCSLFEEKGLALTVRASDGRPQLLADRDELIQVLTNLVSNAASSPGPAGTSKSGPSGRMPRLWLRSKSAASAFPRSRSVRFSKSSARWAIP
jgi:K+-sensing histidine kinase KdpD